LLKYPPVENVKLILDLAWTYFSKHLLQFIMNEDQWGSISILSSKKNLTVEKETIFFSSGLSYNPLQLKT